MKHCKWCNCNKRDYNEYRNCPLFNGEICDICCDWDVVDKDTPKFIKETVGFELTYEEMIEICKQCGKSKGFLSKEV